MNPRAILPWILCAALLLGVGVWWSGGDRGAEGVHLPLAAGDADDTGSQASPFTLHSAGSARSTAESDSRHEEPGDQPGADEDPAVETSPAGYLLVRVVQHPGQAPVAGAELTWMELEPDLLRRAYDVVQVDELLAEGVSRALTDSSGSACLPWSRQRALLVAARSGEQWGSAVERDLETHQLSIPIAPDFHVDVLVRAARPGHLPRAGPPARALPGNPRCYAGADPLRRSHSVRGLRLCQGSAGWSHPQFGQAEPPPGVLEGRRGVLGRP